MTSGGGNHGPIAHAPAATGGESVDAAVTTAAFRVLAWLFPRQRDRLRTRHDASLGAVAPGGARDGGVAVGEATAAAMIAARADDGRCAPVTREEGMTDAARADAHIACFEEKAAWGFWRPVTAIREAAGDGNPDTAPNASWTPVLVVTPAFPDYPSGHACATVANMTVNQRYFGRDDIAFSVTSAEMGVTRRYTSFPQAATEVANARVCGAASTSARRPRTARPWAATSAPMWSGTASGAGSAGRPATARETAAGGDGDGVGRPGPAGLTAGT